MPAEPPAADAPKKPRKRKQAITLEVDRATAEAAADAAEQMIATTDANESAA